MINQEIVNDDNYDDGRVDISEYGQITSHSHYNRWDSLGIWCLAGDNKDDGKGYVELGSDFFEKYKSVTIKFTHGDQSFIMTLTKDGNLSNWVTYNPENGRYEFGPLFGKGNGGIAELIELIKK